MRSRAGSESVANAGGSDWPGLCNYGVFVAYLAGKITDRMNGAGP